MLKQSNKKLIMENDSFKLFVEKGIRITATTPCLVINKNTGEVFDGEDNTIGAWSKFVNDWRLI